MKDDIDKQLAAGPQRGQEVLCSKCGNDWHGQPTALCDEAGGDDPGVLTKPRREPYGWSWGAL
jgi:hypothetical protein